MKKPKVPLIRNVNDNTFDMTRYAVIALRNAGQPMKTMELQNRIMLGDPDELPVTAVA